MRIIAAALAATLVAAACGTSAVTPPAARPPATTIGPAPTDQPPPTTQPPSTTEPPPPTTAPPRTTVTMPPPEPESWVSEGMARRVIEDFLDAVAGSQWEIAASYLWNEGAAPEVEDRLGAVWERSPEELFTAFCAEAACGAEYHLGPTVAFDEWSRTVQVEFATTEGTVAVDVRAGVFEGIVTLGALPPPGQAASPVEPVDRRLFGEASPAGLTVFRYAAVERDGTWTQWWPARWSGRLEAAGDWVAQQWEGSPLHIGRLGEAAAAQPDRYETEATLAGAGVLDGAPVFFLAAGGRLDAFDPAARTQTELLNLGAVTVLGADVAGDLLVVTMSAGGDTWAEVHALEGAAVTVAPPIVLTPAGAAGTARFSPDGARLAVPVGPRPDAADGVVLLDAASGAELGRWRHDGPEAVQRVDYDGRFLVAQLGREKPYGLLVIDAPGGDTRELATGVQVRFG